MTSFTDDQSRLTRQLLESVSDIIYLLDFENKRIEFLSPRAHEILRLPGGAMESLDGVIHPGDKEKMQAHLDACQRMNDHEAMEIELRLQAPDGSYRLFHIRDLVFDRRKDGAVRRITGIMRPAEGARAGEEMAQLLAWKNRELQFVHSELQTFTTLVAHDYLENLKQVYISLEMIISAEAHRFSDPSKAHLRKAQTMLQKLSLLTEDIIAYAALDVSEGRSVIVNLKDMVERVLKDLSGKLEAVHAIVRCADLPTVKGHSLLLPVLFNHLISNSIKFRHSARPLVIDIFSKLLEASTIRHPGAYPGKSYYMVEVKDNGIGFFPVDREKIFEMFYRGHEKAKFKGSGMGLAIVRKIMDIHGGYVAADGVPGEGASICCYFPV
ncbi:ATP-binding protein [Flavitalea sp. BT771]|uniref:sensor histidine kinase n=1 Tax=Flavitalea sp. BT771 TaxID=3063329 RepID=UPI0026E3B710|nr:PAS domain-containing sensor histidine kinase [Flavitalea sp. BT771]MDO6430530.1 ATP-binding protein [Flavitalea sp. BT771]MDV6219330.1 ATP-binding protein [Flavitalea sp. BT771]